MFLAFLGFSIEDTCILSLMYCLVRRGAQRQFSRPLGASSRARTRSMCCAGMCLFALCLDCPAIVGEDPNFHGTWYTYVITDVCLCSTYSGLWGKPPKKEGTCNWDGGHTQSEGKWWYLGMVPLIINPSEFYSVRISPFKGLQQGVLNS